MKSIVLAAGCFWGTQEYYRRLDGVINTKVGYSQGNKVNPTYEEVCKKDTGHAEVCLVEYDENKISLKKILQYFFKIVDPTSLNKQGGDIGPQYRCGIYFKDKKDYEFINQFLQNQQINYSKPLVVELEECKNFYDGENYHQEYLVKNPSGYCHISMNSLDNDDLKKEYKK